jgi:hypothetical protein
MGFVTTDWSSICAGERCDRRPVAKRARVQAGASQFTNRNGEWDMVQPLPIMDVVLRDTDNVPAVTTVDEELIQSIRESYATALGSREGPPQVEETVALESTKVEEPEPELHPEPDFAGAYRPEWLDVGFHGRPENPMRPRHVARADGRGTVELLDTVAYIYDVDDRVLLTPDVYPLSCVCHLLVEVRNPGPPTRALESRWDCDRLHRWSTSGGYCFSCRANRGN